jgi:hypothetical protein
MKAFLIFSLLIIANAANAVVWSCTTKLGKTILVGIDQMGVVRTLAIDGKDVSNDILSSSNVGGYPRVELRFGSDILNLFFGNPGQVRFKSNPDGEPSPMRCEWSDANGTPANSNDFQVLLS